MSSLFTTPRAATPVAISVLFSCLDGVHASLAIKGHNTPDVTLTMIHETIVGPEAIVVPVARDFNGNSALMKIQAQDNETTILARQDGEVIAVAVYEVRLELAETLGTVLVSHVASRIDMTAHDIDTQSSGIAAALDRAFDTFNRDRLPLGGVL